jgi:hypothetical protein
MRDVIPLGSISADLAALRRLAHRCDPTLCTRGPFCCAVYEVEVSEDEMQRMIGLWPKAAGLARHLKAAEADGELFDLDDTGQWTLGQRDDGTCLWAYRDRRQRRLCSVHTAADRLGLDPLATKPAPCTLWPLSLSDGPHPVLSVADDVYEFPCNRRRRGRGLDAGVIELVQCSFGGQTARRLADAAAEGRNC